MDVLSFNPDIETDASDSPFVWLNSYMLQWWAGLFENYHRNSAVIKWIINSFATLLRQTTFFFRATNYD